MAKDKEERPLPDLVAGDAMQIAGESGSDGHDSHKGVPSQADPMIMQMPTQMGEAEKLIQYPTQVGEWLARTSLDEEERMNILGMLITDEALSEGSVDYGRVAWMYAGMKLSDSQHPARQDFLAALMGRQSAMAENIRRSFGNVTNRFNRSINGQQEQR